jgi:L-asparagine transporter-like permease
MGLLLQPRCYTFQKLDFFYGWNYEYVMTLIQSKIHLGAQVYTNCFCFPHSPTWKANVGIWVIEGVAFVVEVQ